MMRSAISQIALLQPRSLKHALQLLHDERGLVPIAGCTDVFVTLNAGAPPARQYLNLWGLAGLAEITARRGVIRIGALCTYTQMIRSAVLNQHLPMLVEAARTIGGLQIQNRGTLGGNIANASPAGDTLPVLAALDATVELRSVAGKRSVGFGEYYTGYRQSVRRRDELITAIEITPPAGRQWFRKVGTRAAQAISKVVMAGVRDDGEVRLAVGSVAPTVLRLRATEHAIADGLALDQVMTTARGEIKPIDDIRSTADYRSTVTANLVRRFLADTAT